MKKSNLIGGVICLAIAGLLTVLNLTLPPEDLMFMVNGVNMPWTPPVVLAIVGIILLATGSEKEEDAEVEEGMVVDEEKAALNKQIERVAWGLFLIMLGGFLFVSNDLISSGWWSIGVGLIFLGLNLARYLNDIRMSGFTVFLGVLSILSGTLELFGRNDFEGAILLIILGAYVIVKPWVEKNQLFGKAEKPKTIE
jgi:hypothetical protein